MIAAAVEPVVHTSPTLADVLAIGCIGGAVVVIVGVLIVLAEKANDYWTDRAVAKAEHDAVAETAVNSWADLLPTHEDHAAAQASIDAGECRVTLTTVRAKNPSRLSEFVAEQKRRSA